jgi:hypothetical protein
LLAAGGSFWVVTSRKPVRPSAVISAIDPNSRGIHLVQLLTEPQEISVRIGDDELLLPN